MSFAKGFLTGFFEEGARQINKASDRVEEYVKADYVSNLEQARTLREEKRAERKQLDKAIATLKNFGIQDEATIANTLDQNGIEGVITLADAVQTAVVERGVKIDPATLITGASDANLTIKDVMKRLEGDLKYIDADVPVRADGDKSFWERTLGLDYKGSALGELEEAFGEDYRTVASEARGEYTYEDPTGSVRIDYAQLQKGKDFKNLSPAEVAKATNDFIDVIKGPMGLDISWDPDAQTYVGADIKSAKYDEALRIASEAGVMYDALFVTYQGNAARARQQTINYLQSLFVNQQEEVGAVTDTTTSTVNTPSDPAEFARAEASRMGWDSLNPDVKRSAKADLVRKLTTAPYNLNLGEAQEIIKTL